MKFKLIDVIFVIDLICEIIKSKAKKNKLDLKLLNNGIVKIKFSLILFNFYKIKLNYL